ncbi:MAG: hypothetical protein ACOY0T_17185 [Myxococcota bacterium]
MPHPDNLLEQVVRLAREDEELGRASERRLTGTASPEDEALTADLPESFTRPISSAQESALVDGIQARLARSRGSAPRWRSVAGASIGVAAIAAGILLWITRTPSEDGPLAPYEVRVEGSLRTERSSAPSSGSLRLRAGSTLRFELRPRSDVHASVHSRVFVRGANSTSSLEEMSVTQQQSAAGALRVDVQVPASLPPTGELLLYVGRRGAIERSLPRDSDSNEVQQFKWSFERDP